MKLALFLSFAVLISCNKKSDSSPVSTTSNGLATLNGTWELCSASGGTDGDYKLTHTFTNTTYIFTEVYYSSRNGTCTEPLVNTTGVHSITKASGVSTSFPDAILLNVTFGLARRISALSSDNEAISRVIDCTSETNPVVGAIYNVTKPNCNWSVINDNPVTAGQVTYTIALIDKTVSPNLLSFGSAGSSPDDGTTALKRHEFLDVTEFIKK